MSDQKNLEPDLDFLRYADDVRESKSLKKFIDSGKEKRFRIRTKEIRLEIKNQFFCQNEPFLSKKKPPNSIRYRKNGSKLVGDRSV